MSPQRIRILAVDDHPMFLRGLTATLEAESDMEVVGCATTGVEALKLFRATLPEVTIMDIALRPDMTGIETTEAIQREFPGARIVVLTAHQEEDVIYRALQAGAATYLFKETLGDDLVRTIREVQAGVCGIPPIAGRRFADAATHPQLTARELEVLKLIADGLRNKEIAGRLRVGEQTVQSHVKNIFEKLHVNDRTKAVTVALRKGIIGGV